jgi:tetratricopeptide (TPR) repeat protein
LDYYAVMNRSLRALTLPLLLALSGIPHAAAATAAPAPPNSVLDAELFFHITVGELRAQTGDYPNAFAAFMAAARKAKSEVLYEKAVKVAYAAGSAEFALQASQEWAGAFPASFDANRYLLQILIGLNRTGEAVEPLKRSLSALNPTERQRAINSLPRIFNRSNDKKLALKVVEQALASDLNKPSTGPSAWTSIGLLRLATNDGPAALDAARRGAALNAQSIEPIYLALNLPAAQDTGAQALVKNFLANNPASNIRLAFAQKLRVNQHLAEAYTQVQRFILEKPSPEDLASALLLRGDLEFQERKFSEAKASLNAYLELVRPASAPTATAESRRSLTQAYWMLADIAEKSQQFDEAHSYLQRIDNPQETWRVLNRRAILLARQGKMEQARALIRAQPELEPTDKRNKISLEVQLLREHKQWPSAYQLLSQTMAQDPQEVEWVYELATVAEKMGKFDEMEQLLRRVIATKPDYHAAYNALGYSLADRNLRLPEARKLIQKALEFAPEDPFIVDSLGWVEFRSGNLTEALRLLQSAFKTRPDPEIAAHLGEVLWALGDKTLAAKIWEQGKALNAENETLVETIQRLSPPL